MGGVFILYVRTIIPSYGHASGSARISQSVPAASLFPDLCRSGPERLSDDLFMDKLCGVTYFYDVPFLLRTRFETFDLL